MADTDIRQWSGSYICDIFDGAEGSELAVVLSSITEEGSGESEHVFTRSEKYCSTMPICRKHPRKSRWNPAMPGLWQQKAASSYFPMIRPYSIMNGRRRLEQYRLYPFET